MFSNNLLFRNLLLALSAWALLSSSAFTDTVMPQPEDFGRSLVEAIKQKDSMAFCNAFHLTEAQLIWWKESMEKDEQRNQGDKPIFIELLSDSTRRALFIQKADRSLMFHYRRIQEWSNQHQLDLSKLEFLRMYFDLRYNQDYCTYYLRRSSVMVKCEERYFAFRFGESLYLKDHWVFVDLMQLEELDQYFNALNEQEVYSSTDSTAVALADTTTIALTRKKEKIQKRISKQELKLEELYQKLY